jgi:hypothetical protein
MQDVDPDLSSAQKLETARLYVADLRLRYPDLDAVIVTGSVVRGNAVGPSDVDLWYVFPDGRTPTDLEKGPYKGVFVDIEPFPIQCPSPESVLEDAYVLGYLSEAQVLFDRSGSTSAVIQYAAAHGNDEPYRERRLHKLVEPIRRDLAALRVAVTSALPDASATCQWSIFALWDLADYLLARDGRPPGGFRVLSRLKLHNPDAFLALVTLQGSLQLSEADVDHFLGLYVDATGEGGYWLDKIRWMIHNGFKDQGFNSLWILLGLATKNGSKLPQTCQRRLSGLGWVGPELQTVLQGYERVVGGYLPNS